MSNQHVHDRLLRDYVLNDFDVIHVVSEQCVHVSGFVLLINIFYVCVSHWMN